MCWCIYFSVTSPGQCKPGQTSSEICTICHFWFMLVQSTFRTHRYLGAVWCQWARLHRHLMLCTSTGPCTSGCLDIFHRRQELSGGGGGCVESTCIITGSSKLTMYSTRATHCKVGCALRREGLMCNALCTRHYICIHMHNTCVCTKGAF